MTQLIIDCDPGIDDALALMLAASSPDVDIVAVTTVTGNRPVEIAAGNARRILDLSGMAGVPVHAGAALPIDRDQARCNLVHGEDGLGGVNLGPAMAIEPGSAVLRIVELVTRHPEHSLTLAAIGPLTNLALAERTSPGVLRRLKQLLIMGGALRRRGNITPAAEFNVYADPTAAKIVLEAGERIVLFPLDVTEQAVMSAEWIGALSNLDSACGRAAGAMLHAYAAREPLLHDVCPIAYLLDRSLFQVQRCGITVECGPGAMEGRTIATFTGPLDDADAQPSILAATSVRAAALLDAVHAAFARLP